MPSATHTHMHSLACMHTNVSAKRTNHNEIEKGVIPIPNIVDVVLIVVHNLQHFLLHLLNRIALNGIALIVCGFFSVLLLQRRSLLYLFPVSVIILLLSLRLLFQSQFWRCALISVFISKFVVVAVAHFLSRK